VHAIAIRRDAELNPPEAGATHRFQCPWQRPPPHPPPPLAHIGASFPALELAEAKTENFLDNFFDPQCGQAVPFQSLERTRISLSRSHFLQWNS
jgi:hypothetical protein